MLSSALLPNFIYCPLKSSFDRIFLPKHSISHRFLDMVPCVLSNKSSWSSNKDVLSGIKLKLSCQIEGHMMTAVSCILRRWAISSQSKESSRKIYYSIGRNMILQEYWGFYYCHKNLPSFLHSLVTSFVPAFLISFSFLFISFFFSLI